MACHIRPASAGDCGDIVRMMKELGAYEKHSHGTEVTEEALIKDGFSAETPFFQSIVAELPEGQKSKEGFTIVGYALYIFSYNSMRGRIIYLEDLYVIPEFRGKGVGKQLLKEVAKIGQDRQCYQIQFAVLNWNQQAIDFYRAQGAIDLTQETGYHIFRFEDAAMTKLAGAEANP
ncbi:diamine acetyltransferase 2 isoform X1 [Microcaecilia unicolor]|uniref:Diamine acetyltransferase 2-like isoform X1 n=1 Tax=Microcaecilia unicolor TaxID=1415580 RepID=A0A6P7WNY6_9AMPH|nr:diamine acetyltransferase 2-like isoform X1 [Microcaecilia unicolor]